MSNQIKISQLIYELNRRAARAVVSQLSFRSSAASNYLRTLFEKLPGEEGSFMADPVFEATFGWQESDEQMSQLRGELLSKAVLTALDSPPKVIKKLKLDDYSFPLNRYPYKHQVAAWETLLAEEKKSVLVSSGTGSGKTECFLIPIIEDLYREYQKTSTPLTGVRALFLYPLNALINSQRERLIAWTHSFEGGLRFCLYNGETSTARTKASVMDEAPQEVCDRTILRENPPPILVTNSTMLEYMLVRNDDEPIIAQSQGKLRWIVLDEAHTYIGSQAAELALLLRRVIDAFNVKAEDVRFVATSATFGGGDEESLFALQKFLADVAGVDESQVQVIKGQRHIPGITESVKKSSLSLDDLSNKSPGEQFDLLCGYAPALKIRKRLAQSPHAATTPELMDDLKCIEKDISKHDIWALIDCMAAANDGNSSFLPVRGHLFQKTLAGIYACTNSACSDRPEVLKDGDWEYGCIYLSERDYCHCGAPVQPIVSCNSCGQEYLEAEEHFIGDGKYEILHPTRHDNDDEFIWDIESDEDVETVSKKDESVKESIVLHYSKSENSIPVRIQKYTRELAHKGGDIVLFGQTSGDATCHTCGAKDRTGWKVFVPKRLGAPFFLGDALPTLLEHSPKHGEGPFESRRLLTFTDSRQGTARIAARLQQDVDRNKVRSVLYHTVHVPPDSSDNENVEKLKGEINQLEEAVQSAPMLKGMVETKKQELLKLESPSGRVVRWRDAEQSLNNSRDISRYMFDAFQDIASTYISKDQFGNFNLFREFMRRSRRGFQLETLGMVEMFYPDVDSLTKYPDSWRQLYFNREDKEINALNDWKDWLTTIIDVFLRGRIAVDFPESWGKLMGAKVYRKYIVAPKDDRDQDVLRWPSAKRSTKSKVVAMLVRGFKLDTESKAVIDHIEQVLEDSWFVIKSKLLSPQDENRYLLNLSGKAAFRKLNKGWKCPYSHRVVSRIFRGQSPNTPGRDLKALQCESIKLPDLPYPHETDRSNRTKIIDWFESDSMLAKAREVGVWPNRADRIAAGEPWFRIAEHSAQIDSQTLKKYEKMFKEGNLNVLSCSTTMEMGVDIGGMSVVAMNNVPPHPANYLQRAGRAGRRKEASSVSYTLCKQSAHSMQVFHDPKWPFSPGVISAPRVSLESANIVQRHVNALLFSCWLRKVGDDIPRLTSGWLMEKENGKTQVDDFIAWCHSIKSQTEYKKLSESIKSITKKTSIDSKNLEQLAEQTAIMIEDIHIKWWNEFSAMLDELQKIEANTRRSRGEPAVKAINISLNRMRKEYLLRDLANGGFLPGYGFPTHVVSLNTISMRELQHSKDKANSREDSFGKMRGDPSRDLAVALREYAPGAEIVMRGLVYRSAGITLNWHRPSNIDAASEIQNLYRHWECKKCGEFGDNRRKLLNCPVCHATKLDSKEVLGPAGFSVDLFADPHTDVSRPTFMPFEDAKVAAVNAAWRTLPNNRLGKIRYSENGLVNHLSSGMYGHGYTLCLCCGRAEPQLAPKEAATAVASEHKRLRGGKNADNGAFCEGPANDYMIKKDLYLANMYQTSVFELQLRDPRDEFKPVQNPTIAWTVGFALRNVLTKRLGVDQREVEVAIRDMKFVDNHTGFSLCLYDTASQGAGYVARLLDDLISLLMDVRSSLDCPVSCDSVCQHCLLDNSSQFKEKHLNRGVAAEWLDEWLKSCSLPNDKLYFGNNSSVNISSLSYQIELVLREQKIDRVIFFLELLNDDPADLSNWSMIDVTQRLISSGSEVEWVLTGENLDAWKARCGSQFSAFLEIYEGSLFISHMLAKNEINETGKIIMAAVSVDQGRYWAGENARLSLTEEWGTVDGPIITTADWIRKIDFPVMQLTSDILKPVVASSSASIKLRTEFDGRTEEFGTKFIEWIKAELSVLGEKIEGNNKLQKLSYSDRYLRAPIHVVLLYQLISSILKTCGDDNTKVNIITTVMPEGTRIPYKLFHNFIDSDDQYAILSGVLSKFSGNGSLDIANHSNQTSHARTLTLSFRNGGSFEIDFDQGMGSWKYYGNNNWDAYADIEFKVKSLINDKGSVYISGKWGTLINLRKIG